MDAFYTLATDDYRHLALAHDWRGFLVAAQARASDRAPRLLDVACGSGKFPSALARYAGIEDAGIDRVDTALLDPSAFSIAAAKAALPPPFVVVEEHETTLQDFAAPAGGYDVVWATHALYAIPADELPCALARFRAAIAPGGKGLIAHSTAAGHYVAFHERYLEAFGPATAKLYIAAETIADTLRAEGASVRVDEIAYESVARLDQQDAVEGYLKRCVFDDSRGLAAMQAAPPLADYIAACRHADGWRFPQRVWLITVDG